MWAPPDKAAIAALANDPQGFNALMANWGMDPVTHVVDQTAFGPKQQEAMDYWHSLNGRVRDPATQAYYTPGGPLPSVVGVNAPNPNGSTGTAGPQAPGAYQGPDGLWHNNDGSLMQPQPGPTMPTGAPPAAPAPTGGSAPPSQPGAGGGAVAGTPPSWWPTGVPYMTAASGTAPTATLQGYYLDAQNQAEQRRISEQQGNATYQNQVSTLERDPRNFVQSFMLGTQTTPTQPTGLPPAGGFQPSWWPTGVPYLSPAAGTVPTDEMQKQYLDAWNNAEANRIREQQANQTRNLTETNLAANPRAATDLGVNNQAAIDQLLAEPFVKGLMRSHVTASGVPDSEQGQWRNPGFSFMSGNQIDPRQYLAWQANNDTANLSRVGSLASFSGQDPSSFFASTQAALPKGNLMAPARFM